MDFRKLIGFACSIHLFIGWRDVSDGAWCMLQAPTTKVIWKYALLPDGRKSVATNEITRKRIMCATITNRMWWIAGVDCGTANVCTEWCEIDNLHADCKRKYIKILINNNENDKSHGIFWEIFSLLSIYVLFRMSQNEISSNTLTACFLQNTFDYFVVKLTFCLIQFNKKHERLMLMHLLATH